MLNGGRICRLFKEGIVWSLSLLFTSRLARMSIHARHFLCLGEKMEPRSTWSHRFLGTCGWIFEALYLLSV